MHGVVLSWDSCHGGDITTGIKGEAGLGWDGSQGKTENGVEFDATTKLHGPRCMRRVLCYAMAAALAKPLMITRRSWRCVRGRQG